MKPIIRAELSGIGKCSAGDVTVTGYAPVLKLCRVLIEKGFDPDCRMEVFRGDTHVLNIRKIGWVAGLRVKERGDGRPVFAPLNGAEASHSDSNANEKADNVNCISAGAAHG